MDWDDWDGWDHMGDWGWGATAVVVLLLLGLLVVGSLLLARRVRRPAPGSYPPPVRSAEQLLAERFARGEIDEEEYRRRLAVLHETRTPTR
ncbi:SHOCT domain-containing protein [Geodermatophilus sp. SYSU D00708]